MAPLFVATFLTRLSAPPAQSMLAFHSSGLCLAHVGPWLCFLSGRVDEAHRALHGSGERAPVEAEMSTDSFHLYGTSGLSIRELSPCWSVQGAGGVLIQLMSRGTAFPISANVTDFQRSILLCKVALGDFRWRKNGGGQVLSFVVERPWLTFSLGSTCVWVGVCKRGESAVEEAWGIPETSF